MNRNSTVLVFGAGGYLGSVMTPLLLEQGYDVIAYDKYYFGEEVLASVADHARLQIIKGDLRKVDPILLDEAGTVVNLAALSNDPSCELDPAWTLEVNRDAAIALARLCSERGVERLLFASSCSVYGASGNGLLTEESPLSPVSLYAKAKVEAEAVILGLASEFAEGDPFRRIPAHAVRLGHQHHDVARHRPRANFHQRRRTAVAAVPACS